MLVLVGRKQAAVDAVGAGRIVEHEVAHPVALTARGGMLEALSLEIVTDDLRRPFALEYLCGAPRLDRPARMHGDRGRAATHSLGQRLGERTLILPVEQHAEVLQEL